MRQQTVEMDRAWNRDYVTNLCKQHAQSRGISPTLCDQSAQLSLGSYERILATTMASDTACAGVRYVSGLDGLVEAKQELEPHWQLTINFSEDDGEKQDWQIIHTPDNQHTVAYGFGEGIDSPKEAARSICNYVTNRGADVR